MFQVAVAGILPQDPWVLDRLNDYLGQIREQLSRSSDKTGMRLIASPSYASSRWLEWAARTGCGVTGYGSSADLLSEKAFDRTVLINRAIRDTLGNALCNQADLLLAVWNEDVQEQDGATWELLRMALDKHLPCIWISTRTKQVYWQEKTAYDTYEPDKLYQMIQSLAEGQIDPVAFEPPSPLLRLGSRLYKRFLGKYRATHQPMDAEQDLFAAGRLPAGSGFFGRTGLQGAAVEPLSPL